MTKLEKAENRAAEALVRYRRAQGALDAERDRHLVAAGWERVYGWRSTDAYRSPGGGRLFTPYAALREQRKREKDKARRAARKGGAR